MKKYLSIDIGGTFIKYSFVNENGVLGAINKLATPDNLPDFLQTVESIVEQNKAGISGVGFSTLGKVDTKEGKIYNGGLLRFLHELPLKETIEKKFDLLCSVSNDAKSAVLAEMWLGNLQGVSNGAAIVLGTGVGGGIVLNGQLLQGNHFQAGELSLLLRSPGSPEIVGFSGSGVRFVEKVENLLHLPNKSDGMAVFEEIKSKRNAAVNQLFVQYCQEIAHIISNLQVTLDLDKLVIGGGISEQQILIEEINRQYDWLREESIYVQRSIPRLEIDVCKFKNNANLLGAVYPLLIQ